MGKDGGSRKARVEAALAAAEARRVDAAAAGGGGVSSSAPSKRGHVLPSSPHHSLGGGGGVSPLEQWMRDKNRGGAPGGGVMSRTYSNSSLASVTSTMSVAKRKMRAENTVPKIRSNVLVGLFPTSAREVSEVDAAKAEARPSAYK